MVYLTGNGGYCQKAGNRIHQHYEDNADKGIILSQLASPNPEDTYRSNTWGAVTTSRAEQPTEIINDIDQDTWIKWRARKQQYGLQASEQIYGSEWYPVSGVAKPSEQMVKPEAELYNINSAAYLAGHAVLPPNLGRGLKGSQRVLQRAPGDLFITGSKKHNDQTIISPGGVASGLEGIKLKMV